MHHNLQLAITVTNDRRRALITDAERRRRAGRPRPGSSSRSAGRTRAGFLTVWGT
jgi:hypothetical protein